MINKDNQITIGHNRKKQFKSSLCNYIVDKRQGVAWEIGDVFTLSGLISYYRSVEGENIDGIIRQYNAKYGGDIEGMLRDDMKIRKE